MTLRSLAIAPAVLALGLSLAGPAQAGAGDTTVVRTIHCHPIVCVERKVVTEYNGAGPEVITLRRTEPVESRTSNLPGRVSHWTAWHIVSVA